MWFSLALASPLYGNWTFSQSTEEIAAVERVRSNILGEYSVLIRPLVRPYLEKPLAIHSAFRFEEERFWMEAPDAQTYPVAIGQTLTGEGGSVNLVVDGEGFLLDLLGKNQGHITHRLRPAGDLLTVTTTIDSPKLDGPHTWTLSYRRTSRD